MKFRVLVEYEYPVEHKTPVKAELILHGDRVVTDNIKWIEQEPKKGHWIDIDETHSKCSRCGAVFEIYSENGEAIYCPNCGSDNREVKE